MSNTIRLTVKRGRGINAYEEGAKIAAFLFDRCNGDISEAALVAYLRRAKAEAANFPGTGAAYVTPTMRRLMDAVDE